LAPVFFLATLCLVGWANSPGRVGSSRALALLALVVGARLVEILPEASDKFRSVARATMAQRPLDFEPQRFLAQRLERALAGEVVAHRHNQALKYFAPQLSVMDLTGITQPSIARLPAPGPVSFGRQALQPALEAHVGAIHLDPAIWRHEPASVHDLSDLSGNPSAWNRLLGGEPLPIACLSRLKQRYRCASLGGVAGPETWANLLVREDLAGSFRRAGFQVFGP